MTAKYGARGETTQRLPKALRSRMKVVAATGGYKTMLEWLEAKIDEDEETYRIAQSLGLERLGKRRLIEQ
jgi:hypothetical protein